MIEIGNYNKLRVVKEVDFGVYLDGGDAGEILMPLKYVPEGTKPDDEVEVFIYSDSEDRLIATRETPLAKVGEFACLKVKSVNKYGAFLDWGLLKDLLVPFREQKSDMIEGYSYVVYIYLDEQTNRPAASAKVEKYFIDKIPEYEVNQEVKILIQAATEIGYKAIVENKYSGLLYKNEVYRNIEKGDKTKAYIKKIREDGKIDLSLQKSGYQHIDETSLNILETLKDKRGFIAASDKSTPEMINAIFGISKKAFKKAIGALYKQRLITITDEGIKLIE